MAAGPFREFRPETNLYANPTSYTTSSNRDKYIGPTLSGSDHLKPIAILLGLVLILMAGGCTTEYREVRHINLERNSDFDGTKLRLYVTLTTDNRPISVNTEDDVIETSPSPTPIPGHTARQWTFHKNRGKEGFTIAHALVSWDPDNPADYLLAGWWSEFPADAETVWDSERWRLVDGPELDHGVTPEIPTDGTASYVGPAGGLYYYIPGSDWGEDEGKFVVEEYQATINITADFQDGTIKGCVGCIGDLVTRRAHFGVFLGEELLDLRETARDYEMHLGTAIIRPDWDGQFHRDRVTLRHPTRNITLSEGGWAGAVSSKQDADGNPRVIGGFNSVYFEEGDGSVGRFDGSFMAPSETFRASGGRASGG